MKEKKGQSKKEAARRKDEDLPRRDISRVPLKQFFSSGMKPLLEKTGFGTYDLKKKHVGVEFLPCSTTFCMKL